MEIKEFNQKLSEERRKFAELAQKTRDSYADDLANVKKNNEAQREELANNYRDNLVKAEKATADTIEIQGRNARDALFLKESELNEKNRLQKEEFERQNSSTRAEMNKRLGSLRESYDNIQKHSEQKPIDLARNYNESLRHLEDDTRKSLEQRNKLSKEAVTNLKDDLYKKLSEVRENSLKDRAEIKRDAVRNTADAQQSYNNSLEQNKRQYEISLENAENSFDRDLKATKQEIELMNENQKKNSRRLDNYSQEENDRVRKMVLNNLQEKNQLITDGNESRDKVVKKLQGQLDETKKAHQKELEFREDTEASKKKLALNANDERLQKTEQKYQKIIKDLGDTENANIQRVALDGTLKLDQVRKDSIEDRNAFRRQTALLKDSNEYKEQLSKSNENHLKDQFDRVLQAQKIDNENDAFKLRAMESLSKDDAKEIIKERDIEHVVAAQKRDKEFNESLVDKDIKSNKREVNLQDSYQTRIKDLIEENSRQVLADSEAFQRKFDKQNLENAKNAKITQEQNSDNVSDLNKGFSKEKTALIERARKELYDQSLGQKEQHQKVVDATVDSYEKRLLTKNKEIQRLQEMYENKLAVYQKNSQEELAALKKNHLEATEYDKRATRDLLTSRDKEYAKRLEALKGDLDITLAKMFSQNEAKISKITERYESMISRMQAENKSTLEVATRQAKTEYDKLLTNSQDRVESLKNQYELKLEKMRLSNISEDAKRDSRNQEMSKV